MKQNNNARILPSYPIFVKDPYFSLWSGAEELNSKSLETWYGEKKDIYGFFRNDEETYCFLGVPPENTKKARQISLNVTAFSTDYEFECGKAKLKVRFVSPLPPDDLEILSLPVCYMEYETDASDVEISLFAGRNLSYNDIPETHDKRVRGGVIPVGKYESAFMGLVRQLPLSTSGDLIGADWGYWYVAGEQAFFTDDASLKAYLKNGVTEFSAEKQERYIGAICKKQRGAIAIGFDDCVSINYFGSYRKGYYLQDHTILEALREMLENRSRIEKALSDFENKLLSDAIAYGDKYKAILFASLRQCMAAHKLVKDEGGNLLFLSKEHGSGGFIATVDVTYPSIPLFLKYNPKLAKGMIRPILNFARMPVWEYDFAPHDAGMYPSCSGQLYGTKNDGSKYHGKIDEGGLLDTTLQTRFPLWLLPKGYNAYDFNLQMPVEESANLLIVTLGICRATHNTEFFQENADLFGKWVNYLTKYGLYPENQLCTDDFAGHLKNNVNLAIKATVGIACYAELLKMAGEETEAAEFRKIAEQFAAEIIALSEKGTHLPLTWDSEAETFGLKYNFAFDKIFGLTLFPQSVFEKEVDYCLTKANVFGIPLDNRKGYTKSDWLLWSARLTDDENKREVILNGVSKFLTESPDRVPFSDWYETESGKFINFRGRSVQGGCFILLL